MKRPCTCLRIVISTFLILSLACISCAAGTRLDTGQAISPDAAGIYTLILYGGRFSADIETVVFLDREGDDYIFEPYTPKFNYKVERGLSIEEALTKADEFVGRHTDFRRPLTRKVLNEKGEAIGYEVRPLYLPYAFGTDDVMDIDYRLKDGKVTVFIRLIPSVEKILRGEYYPERDP